MLPCSFLTAGEAGAFVPDGGRLAFGVVGSWVPSVRFGNVVGTLVGDLVGFAVGFLVGVPTGGGVGFENTLSPSLQHPNMTPRGFGQQKPICPSRTQVSWARHSRGGREPAVGAPVPLAGIPVVGPSVADVGSDFVGEFVMGAADVGEFVVGEIVVRTAVGKGVGDLVGDLFIGV